MIDIKKIDPSPYQHRKYFDENSLKELGASYAVGLIMLWDFIPFNSNKILNFSFYSYNSKPKA